MSLITKPRVSKKAAQKTDDTSYLIRPVKLSDAPDLLTLVKFSEGGLSSLQPRLDYLKDYIKTSVESFAGTKPTDSPHKYLLGLFAPDGEQLIGCAAVKTGVGIESPFINFDIQGDGLDEYLVASRRYTGATEVGSLFLHPDYRASGLGRYLAKVRYLLIASEPWRFGDSVIAELRGICGQEGSPLYDYMFKDTLDMSFMEADAQYYDRDPNALGDIVPIGRIPTADLPLAVKASIGQPHKSGVGAMRLLQSEGFIFSGTIDLFDAGPIMSVYRDTIRTILQSQTLAFSTSDTRERKIQSLIAVGDVKNFRAIISPAEISDTSVLASRLAQDVLSVSTGETVRVWQSPAELSRKNTAKAGRSHV